MANLIRELRAQLGTTPVNDPCAVLIVPWDHSSLVESGNRTGTDTALFCQVHAGEGQCRGTAFVDIRKRSVGDAMDPSRIERLALSHDSHRKTPIQTNGETEAIVSFAFAYGFVLNRRHCRY